jgi:ribonucleotide monophosphatase NagD (HAD superfamily)
MKVQNLLIIVLFKLLDKHKIEIIYATNHAPFVESFNRTMKRMMDRYMEANDIPSWTTIYRDLLNAYNNTKHSTTGFAPNDIQKEDIDTVRKNINSCRNIFSLVCFVFSILVSIDY